MGDRVRVDRSTRFYWIGTLSGGAIRSGWLDRSGLPRSVQPAGGRSGPNGSLSFNGIDRYFPPNPPLQPAEKLNPTRELPRNNYPPTPTRGKTPLESAHHLETAIPPLQPAEKRHSKPRNTPYQPIPHPNPRKNPTPTRVILQTPTPAPNLRHSLTPTGAQRQRTPPTDPFQASVQSSKFPYTKD